MLKPAILVACCAQLCVGCSTLDHVNTQRGHQPAFVLARDGKPACTIILPENPTPAARLAALELQYHVLKITGAELPIRTDKESVAGRRVLVGESAATRELGFKGSDFAPQEYLIAFRSETVILIGRDWEDTEPNRREFGRPMSCGDTMASTRQRIEVWCGFGRSGMIPR